MSTECLSLPTSIVRLGLGRSVITPPVGIYHRLWGAARHDRATAVHRPLLCDVIVIAALGADQPGMVRAQLDLCGLVQTQHRRLEAALGEATGTPAEAVVITYSHTHAGGWYAPDRFPLPGGELIPGYLDDLEAALRDAGAQAVGAMQQVTIDYATGRCAMAANRDYWDQRRAAYVCGFNPDVAADETLLVARITAPGGQLLGTIVNYGCHPTTLAWENTLISPDYPGSLREVVESATERPCVFLLGACGDLGPRYGFVGDTGAADQNGRQVGYAALSSLAGMGPAASEFRYAGAVVSGATLGVWQYQPRRAALLNGAGHVGDGAGHVGGGTYTVDLALKPRPDAVALCAEIARWEADAAAADRDGEVVRARDCAAHAERARRWLAQLDDFPPGTSYPLSFSVHRIGDAIWVACGAEPYSFLQTELRRRFPQQPLLVSPLAGDVQIAYLLTADRYGLGLYEEEPSIMAPGCLEALIDAIAGRISDLLRG